MLRPTDGTHRAPDPHRQWCKNQFNMLAEMGIWGVPRSGLSFQRQGNILALIERLPGFGPAYQQGEFELIRKRFASAGIVVVDRTGGKK